MEPKQKQLFREMTWDKDWAGPIDEALAELEREHMVRLKCYDRWVAEGRMSWVEARDRLNRHLTAINLLRRYDTSLEERAAREELEALEKA